MDLLTTVPISEMDPVEAFYGLLDKLPPVGQLIECIPHSLPLVERIFLLYQRMSDNARESAWRQLECVQLLNGILWWLAFMEERRSFAVKNSAFLIHKLETPFTYGFLAECDANLQIEFPLETISHSPDFGTSGGSGRSTISLRKSRAHSMRSNKSKCPSIWTPTPSDYTAKIISILRVIHSGRPEILEDIISERRQLAECLECLGCHGLVNAHPTGRLVRLVDAAVSECIAHKLRVKKAIHRMHLLKKNPVGMNTNQPSHQRQVNLKLSQVIERLRQNEMLERLLFEIMHNNQLSSLLRIARKRIQTDKILIGMFNSYLTTIPSGFSVIDKNPMAAKLIFVFKNAYDQFAFFVESVASMPLLERPIRQCEESSENTHNMVKLTNPSSGLFSLPGTVLPEGDAITIFGGDSLDYRVASSTMQKIFNSMLDTDRTTIVDEKFAFSRASSFASRRRISGRPSQVEEEENPYFEAELCQQHEDATKSILLHVNEEIVIRYTNLFLLSGNDVLSALNLLIDMRNCRFLQYKAILMAITICFETAKNIFKQQFFEVLKITAPNASDDIVDEELDRIMFRHYAYRVMERNAIPPLVDVLTRVESGLGVNSLRSCQRFRCFVSDCMDVSWELARHSTIKLEYESTEFDANKYSRTAESNTSHQKIRQCVWPGILAAAKNEERVILKAQVLT